MKHSKIILLLSGGLDSSVLLYHLIAEGHSVSCLLFEYGQRHVQELQWAKHHCRRLGVNFKTVTIPQLCGSSLTGGAGSVVVPNRNAVFIGIGVNEAASSGASFVAIGCNKDDEEMFPDCRQKFIAAINNCVEAAEISVRVIAPFLKMRKWQIVGLGQEMAVPLNETWSCYAGGASPCGKCVACKTRAKAFKK